MHAISETDLLFILGARFDDGAGSDNEVQRTMLELINQVRYMPYMHAYIIASCT